MATTETRVLAVGYDGSGEGDAALDRLAARLAADGFRLAGVLQDPPPEGDADADDRPSDAPACTAMTARLIGAATETAAPRRISEYRGAFAAGCRLDTAAFEATAGLAEAALGRDLAAGTPPDLFVVSKFGPRECDGGGLRQAIGVAVAHGVPVLTTVKADRRDAFLAFTGEFGAVVDWAAGAGEAAVLAWAATVRAG
jgi:hypothetical protein